MWTYGCLRLVGCLKLYVSIAEYRLFYRALLQKRPIIWSCAHSHTIPVTHKCNTHGNTYIRKHMQHTRKHIHTQAHASTCTHMQDNESTGKQCKHTHKLMRTYGCLRLVGCLKLYGSIAEHRLFYRALLQKRPIILFVRAYPGMHAQTHLAIMSGCICCEFVAHTHAPTQHTNTHAYQVFKTSNADTHLLAWYTHTFGVASISRLLKIIGLFCKRAL